MINVKEIYPVYLLLPPLIISLGNSDIRESYFQPKVWPIFFEEHLLETFFVDFLICCTVE